MFSAHMNANHKCEAREWKVIALCEIIYVTGHDIETDLEDIILVLALLPLQLLPFSIDVRLVNEHEVYIDWSATCCSQL